MAELKRCTKCKRELPATTEYFYSDKSKRHGVGTWCKVCTNARNREQYAEDPDKYRERQRNTYAQNPDKIRERRRSYNEKHRSKKHEYDIKYYAKNSARKRELVRQYQIKHPVAVRAYANARRAKKLAAEGRYTAEDVQRIYKAQKGKCYYCGAKVGRKYEVDHVVPLSRGGTNWPDNLVIACPSCNSSKNNKLSHEWQEGGKLL